MALKFGVYEQTAVSVDRSGYSARAVGSPVATAASFDEAYDAALSLGGDRWVISSVGSSEYVEAVRS